ncbi:hypothetical protein [Streptomyces ipomoeae]|uniref:hypothetical protein n=1 Tax=Streptomyces ipomoeae TaxID=103232 RepID=UPI0029BE352B|nr:hypothetical protein [Streptomyces ipomoeae]MDX2700788.1 hypothetical protein [Streptomyces ipomoeae]MDX2845410.1 hypothetical protein [Streptomyces ipomoeae]
MIVALIAVLGLAPGLVTVWHVRRTYGWPWHWALLAGAAVIAALVIGLLGALMVLAPLAIICAAGCALAALHAYDQGRLLTATNWACLAGVFTWCAEWTL